MCVEDAGAYLVEVGYRDTTPEALLTKLLNKSVTQVIPRSIGEGEREHAASGWYSPGAQEMVSTHGEHFCLPAARRCEHQL
jgi:hypothetical protein